jgi:hypothetical protein
MHGMMLWAKERAASINSINRSKSLLNPFHFFCFVAGLVSLPAVDLILPLL